jgi:hypothetical protein
MDGTRLGDSTDFRDSQYNSGDDASDDSGAQEGSEDDDEEDGDAGSSEEDAAPAKGKRKAPPKVDKGKGKGPAIVKKPRSTSIPSPSLDCTDLIGLQRDLESKSSTSRRRSNSRLLSSQHGSERIGRRSSLSCNRVSLSIPPAPPSPDDILSTKFATTWVLLPLDAPTVPPQYTMQLTLPSTPTPASLAVTLLVEIYGQHVPSLSVASGSQVVPLPPLPSPRDDD